jgi:uncharacterized protein (DUF488 family)
MPLILCQGKPNYWLYKAIKVEYKQALPTPPMQVLTAGHSNRSFNDFVSMLTEHNVTLLCDVRSKPMSRYFPHFNRLYLQTHLPMSYIWQPSLGGFDEHISAEDFNTGIEELVLMAKEETVLIMCSEKDHQKCHRYSKIAPALEQKGITVIHIS